MNSIDPVQFGKVQQGVEFLVDSFKDHKKDIDGRFKAVKEVHDDQEGRIKSIEDLVLIFKSRKALILLIVWFLWTFLKPFLQKKLFEIFYNDIEVAEMLSYLPLF